MYPLINPIGIWVCIIKQNNFYFFFIAINLNKNIIYLLLNEYK